MKPFDGWQFPDHEAHLQDWMRRKNQVVHGRLAYQYDKLVFAVGQAERKRVAVDIGGHVGLWSFYLSFLFNEVIAFEPVAEHRLCFAENTKGRSNISLVACALGEKPGKVSIHTTDGSSGDSYVRGTGEIDLRRLDDVLATQNEVDFIKADCEGYELFALKGGEQLIRRCLPVICVEQKPGRAQKFGLKETEAVRWLEGIGYTLVRELGGDFILVPR